MSVGKKATPSGRGEEEGVEGQENGGGAVVHKETKGVGGGKKAAARYDRCFSGLELSIGPGPLRDVDAGKLKSQIRRWARAVVAYARQISFGSPRSRRSSSSVMSRGRSTGAAARSATFPSKSGLGGAKGEPEPPP